MRLNQFVVNTDFPPVIEVASWVEGRHYPSHRPLIDLSQAVPDYPASPGTLDHMADRLLEPETGKYGPVPGLPGLRQAYASHLNRQLQVAATVEAENVAITAGCNQAFYVAIATLCGPQDQVILPNPWYFNHKMSLDMLGVEAIALNCEPANNMIPEASVARSLVTPQTRAIVLVTPNNPTGQVYPAKTINEFFCLAREAGIALIIDETYRDFHPDAAQEIHPVFEDADWSDTAVHLYSFSKAYALAGYRVGALVASRAFQHQATKILDCISICASQLSQHAALYGLRNSGDWKVEKQHLMRSRSIAFQQAINNQDHGFEIAATGAYFAYLKHPYKNLDAFAVAQFLASEASLLVLPGEMFGQQQERYLRIAFANVDESNMQHIADRLCEHRPASA